METQKPLSDKWRGTAQTLITMLEANRPISGANFRYVITTNISEGVQIINTLIEKSQRPISSTEDFADMFVWKSTEERQALIGFLNEQSEAIIYKVAKTKDLGHTALESS